MQGEYPQSICHSNTKVAGILQHDRIQVIELPQALPVGKNLTIKFNQTKVKWGNCAKVLTSILSSDRRQWRNAYQVQREKIAKLIQFANGLER